MAINVSFNGATIFKPGAYSKINIDLSGGFPLGQTGLVAIFGESTRGKPGSAESDISQNVFSPNQIAEVREKYGTGPLVDSMNFLFAPASDGNIPSGAQAVYVYKTNASTRSTLALASSYGTVRSLEYGIGGNTVTYSASETAEVAGTVTGSPFDATAIVGGETMTIGVNGGAVNVFTASAAAITRVLMQADLDDTTKWSLGLVPVGMTFTAGGLLETTATITVAQDADATAAQNGYGRSFEISASAGLGVVDALSTSSVESAMTVTIKQTRDLLEEQDTIGGNIVLEAGYDGSETTGTVAVTATQVTLTAGANPAITFDKNAYPTLLQLVDAMNLTTDWSVVLSSTLYNSLSPDVLDVVSSIGAKATAAATIKPTRIKKDAYEAAQLMLLSSIVDITAQSDTGLMDALSETALAGGALGASTTADITNALAAFQEVRVNSVVPLFSRDATADITDNLTDASSTYTALGIHQSVKTHCSLMSTTKNRSERQGYISLKDTFVNCLDRASLLADARLQLCIQDTRNTDSIGNIKWFQPWSLSAMVAGARGGSPVGTPLTFKFFNTTGIRQTAQPMSTAEEDIVLDFNPNTEGEQAIQGGITFLEAPQSGGIRCVVDNTTYQKDANWVKNRGNVQYAADVLAFDFRNQLENIFVGQKNNIQASEIKSVAASILATFLAQGITVATEEAPNGYKKLDVALEGNIVRINAIVVLVEGIDFILNDITISRVQSEA